MVVVKKWLYGIIKNYPFLDSFYIVSTKVSSRHLKMHTQFRLIVKNELVASYGNEDVVSSLGAKTRHVAQQSSNFSNLKTVDVVVIAGSLLIGIANGVDPLEHVYSTIGLVLQKVVQFCPKKPLSQVCKHVSF